MPQHSAYTVLFEEKKHHKPLAIAKHIANYANVARMLSRFLP